MMPMTKQRLDIPLKLKSVSDSGEFEGYGSVFGVKDSYDDVVVPGAFSKSLQSWREKNALPAMLWQHQMDEPIGVYTEMKEDDVGLYVKGRLLIDDDPLSKRAHAHMKAGSLTGLSIGYMLKDWEYDREKGVFLLKEIDLWEVTPPTQSSITRADAWLRYLLVAPCQPESAWNIALVSLLVNWELSPATTG